MLFRAITDSNHTASALVILKILDDCSLAARKLDVPLLQMREPCLGRGYNPAFEGHGVQASGEGRHGMFLRSRRVASTDRYGS